MTDIPSFPERAKYRQQMLEKIQSNSTDDGLRRMASDVLAGKAELRDALRRPEVNNAMSSRMQQFKAQFDALTDGEKAQIAHAGQQELESSDDTSPEVPRPVFHTSIMDEEDFSTMESWLEDD